MGAAAQQFRKLLAGVLRIQPGEGHRVALMFGIMLCVVGSFIAGRMARDSLFLSRYSENFVDYLPYLYIWVALGVCLQSYLYSRIADRFRRDRTLAVSMAGVVALTLLARYCLEWVGAWFYPVLYVMVELTGSLLLIQTWTLANDVFTTREAKRLFGLVGAGGVVSSVVVGFSVHGVVEVIGTENLLNLCALALAVGLLLLRKLSRHCRDEIQSNLSTRQLKARSRISFVSDWGRIFASRHLILVAGLMVLLTFVMTFVDYQFKISAGQEFPKQEGRLAEFFGLFYGITGIISCVIQILLTGRILERFGILVSVLVLPISLLAGTIALLLGPALWSAAALKGGDTVFRYTVNDATMQFLFLPVPSHVRGRAKAFVDGIIRPTAIGLSGAALAWVLPNLRAGALGWILLVMLLAWIATAVGVRRQYLASLLSTIMTRRLHFDEVGSIIPDDAASRVLRKAFGDTNEENVLHALEMTTYSPNVDWSNDLIALANHSSAAVRARALQLLGERGTLNEGPLIAAALRDRNPIVQAAAIQAYCAIGKERAIRSVVRFLDHPEISIRSATVIGLVRYGGLDGVMNAAERLKGLIESDDSIERAAGARILGEIGVKSFYHPLLALLADSELVVRLAAVRAAARMQSPELLPAVVYRLEEPEVRSAATDALAAFGPPAVTLLRRVLANPDEPNGTRVAIPAILARIGGQPALDALLEHLEDADVVVRSPVLENLHWMRLHQPGLSFKNARIRQTALTEIRAVYQQLVQDWDLDLPADAILLSETLARSRERALRRVFHLLACSYPPRTIDAVWYNLPSQDRQVRANAIEVLDNVLDKEIKRLLLPVVDGSPREIQEEIVREFGLERLDQRQRLRSLVQAEDPWLCCCAIYASGQLNAIDLIPDILVCTASENPLVRETALAILWKLAGSEKTRATVSRHLRDPSPRVRSYANWLLQACSNDGVGI